MGREARCEVHYGRQTSEGKALLETSEILFRGDFRLKIPMQGGVGSLNASVSAAILLYEVARQRAISAR